MGCTPAVFLGRGVVLSRRKRNLPDIVISCDWSKYPEKRWSAAAVRRDGGGFTAEAPSRVVSACGLVAGAKRDARPDGWALLGFDNPIGVPRAYATAAGIHDFPAWVPGLGQGAWSEFFDVCDHREEITLQRPFFPNASRAGTRRSDLTDALGIPWHDLLRRCERATDDRNTACCLFWTLGGNQVGKAALAMWNEILQPALEEGLVAVWPFHGRLPALLVAGRAVLAETYPGESYHHVGAVFANAESKRKRPDRVSKAAAILGWAGAHGVVLTPAATAAVQDGFGDDDYGEDRFDAFVGLLGILEVVLGIVPDGVPANDPAITATEGWILGQQ